MYRLPLVHQGLESGKTNCIKMVKTDMTGMTECIKMSIRDYMAFSKGAGEEKPGERGDTSADHWITRDVSGSLGNALD